MLSATWLRTASSGWVAMNGSSGSPSSQLMVSSRLVDSFGSTSGTWTLASSFSIRP